MHPQFIVIFALTQLLHSSGAISLLFTSSILDIYWPGGLIFQYHIFLPFHTAHGIPKGRILEWFSIIFSSGPPFVRTLHYDLSILAGPSWHDSRLYWFTQDFIELHVVSHLVILASFLWWWFCSGSCGIIDLAFSACPLMDEISTRFLMRGVGCGENLVLLWWSGQRSVNL